MVERYQGQGDYWILANVPPLSARFQPDYDVLRAEISYCRVRATDRTGNERSGNSFTHHICPHHNCIVVWLDS